MNNNNNNNTTTMGQYIIVATGGFVYVGLTDPTPGDFLILKSSLNIRRWGTTRGLGQLATGPTPDTQLDPSGEVWFPWHSIVSIHPVTGFTL
jgi:hypothetical protein